MKITLKRKLELKSVIVYLKLHRRALRDEIRGYLNNEFNFSNKIVEERVQIYLRNEKFYDDNGALTEKGMETKKTGLVKEPEEGAYQIWYTHGDFLFGNRVFYFKRVRPDPYNSNIKWSELKLTGEFHSLPVRGVAEQDSEFTVDKMAEWQEEKEPSVIDCTWVWNGIDSSEFKFSGELKTSDTDKKGKSSWNGRIDETKSMDLNIPLVPHIPTILPDWNPETNRCKFKLKDIQDNNIYKYFESTGNSQRAKYDSCHYEKLPVEPYNFEEAKKWREQIIKLELANDYMHPDDFTGYIIETNQKEGFSAYADDLYTDIPEAKEYISELDTSKKSERAAAFWHLAAPVDLNVDIPQSLKKDFFSFAKNDTVSLRQIAEKLLHGASMPETILYYDKYVVKYHQQRSVFAFLVFFDNAKIHVITDTKREGFSDYLKKKPSITLKDIGDVYPHSKDIPHDRHIVFKHGAVFDVWKCTNSIDYIRFDVKGDISPSDLGEILTGVTFTKVESRFLDEGLKKYLETDR